MVRDTEVRIDGFWAIHSAGKVIASLCYYTTEDKVGLAEKILREEYGLVGDRELHGLARGDIKFVNLVYERGSGNNPGIAHFHLFFRDPSGSHISFHHWVDRMTPEDFVRDALSPILERLYHELQPSRVTSRMQIPLKEKLPWEK